jgi:hypothetical protein
MSNPITGQRFSASHLCPIFGSHAMSKGSNFSNLQVASDLELWLEFYGKNDKSFHESTLEDRLATLNRLFPEFNF